MISHELMRVLVHTSVLSSVAIVIALLLRKPLRRSFGAQTAYVVWSLVPVALVSSALPVPMRQGQALEAVVQLAAPMRSAVAWVTPAGSAPNWLGIAALLWLLGSVGLLVWMTFAQQRFMRSLGELRHGNGGQCAQHDVPGLPATVGVLRPQIVLPTDFETRYSAQQQILILAHERTHIARGDHWMNAFALAMQCAFWFNPLVHLAQRCFRQDQELACDASVLAQLPMVRSAYGQTLLQQQLAAQATPLGCHFGFSHPLKERLLMLNADQPSALRRGLGRSCMALLFAGMVFTTWAAQSEHTQTHILQKDDINLASRLENAPHYPADAVKDGKEGTVILLVNYDTQGRVTNAVVERSSGDARLDQSALDVVPKWTFKPEIKNGKPVAGKTRVPVEFAMDEPGQKATSEH
ncbi:MAG: TonB family protein [Thermomonas sp.]|uniref:TonB family protein n=1 Tax=Thermomonas sp. TaxID=1971895 RepID=UPI001EC9C1C3|nr:TonB family protein [Thermomonas sp.]MBV2208827.1 TonB family protein [Thermomonas sp.]